MTSWYQRGKSSRTSHRRSPLAHPCRVLGSAEVGVRDQPADQLRASSSAWRLMISIFSACGSGPTPVVSSSERRSGLGLGLGVASAAAIRASNPSAASLGLRRPAPSTMSASRHARTILPRMNRCPFCPAAMPRSASRPSPGPVHHAAHHGHLDGQLQLLREPPAPPWPRRSRPPGPVHRGAGDEVEPLALPQPERLEELAPRPASSTGSAVSE